MSDVVIVNAKRTAIGKFLGSLSGLSAPQIGSSVIDAIFDESKIEKSKNAKSKILDDYTLIEL